MRAMTDEMREKRFRNVGDPRRTDRFKSTYEHGAKSPFVVHGIAAYERAFKLMDETLSEHGGPWIVGPSPTLADINMMPYAARLEYLGLIGAWLDARPRVREWWARAQDWPYFKSGLHDLISEHEFSEMRTHGPKILDDVTAAITRLRAN
jgi:glutathione S-transferase